MKRHNIPNYEAYQSEIKTIPPIDVEEIKDALTKLEQPASEKDLYLYLAVLTRLLYSCLVDADFLDTENFMSGQERKCGDSIDEIYKAAKERLHKKGWLKESSLTTLNGRRSFILRTAMEIGKIVIIMNDGEEEEDIAFEGVLVQYYINLRTPVVYDPDAPSFMIMTIFP